MTEDQQKFWDILSNNYPKITSCRNCLYFAPNTPGACNEPEYVKNQSPSCYPTDTGFSKWKWNGKGKMDLTWI